jgi:hypothetical protein
MRASRNRFARLSEPPLSFQVLVVQSPQFSERGLAEKLRWCCLGRDLPTQLALRRFSQNFKGKAVLPNNS